MGGKIGGALDRRMRRRIARRHAGDPRYLADLARHDARVLDEMHRNAEIVAALDEVGRRKRTVRQDQRHAHLRIKAGEGGDGGRKLKIAEGHGSHDLQVSLRLVLQARDACFLRLEIVERLHAEREVFRAGLGERDVARRAVEQTDAEMLFELLEMRAGQRPRDAEFVRSLRQALRFRDLHEGADGLETIHRVPFESVVFARPRLLAAPAPVQQINTRCVQLSKIADQCCQQRRLYCAPPVAYFLDQRIFEDWRLAAAPGKNNRLNQGRRR